MLKFVGLRAKNYSYLIDVDSEEKNAKGTKACVIKRKLKIENQTTCLEATQLENKINYLEKNEINKDSLKKKKEFIKNNKIILKAQKSIKSERYNVFTEVVNKIDLSLNNDNKNAMNEFDRIICILSE